MTPHVAPPLSGRGGITRGFVTQARLRGEGGARGPLGVFWETAQPPFCRIFVAAVCVARRRFGFVSQPEGFLLLQR